MLVILIFRVINDDSVVNAIFTAASYTYGPLLGLFAFGILTKRQVADKLVPYICVLSPLFCYLINTYLVLPYTAYAVGFELIIYNGTLTWLMLWVTSRQPNRRTGI